VKQARWIALPLLIVEAACGRSAAEEGALRRGDVAWARGSHEEALAEYRLALRRSESPETLLRIAHAYAELGRASEAGDFYRQAVEARPEYAGQASADLLRLARRADERGDSYGVATAIELANELEPGVGMGRLGLPLARHFAELGDFGRALPHYQRAMSTMQSDDVREIVFEMAIAYEEVGDCTRALTFFEQSKRGANRSQAREADWHIGSCAFELGSRNHQDQDDDEALRYLDMMIELGEPRSLLPQAYFEKAEVLAERGDCTAALEAFTQVVRQSTSRSSPLVTRAEQRIDEIRFGRPNEARPPQGRC
jgi:tetratricopeptide (TPR) repeat protein